MFIWAWLKLQLKHLFPGEEMLVEQPLDERLAEIITDVLEDEYYRDKISLVDKQEKYRKLSVALDLPDLLQRQLTEKELAQKPPRSHAFIVRRTVKPSGG